MEYIHLDLLLNATIFSLLGVAIFWLSFIVIDMLTPYDLWREIIKERNQPLAIVVAAMCLGVAMIVAASVHG